MWEELLSNNKNKIYLFPSRLPLFLNNFRKMFYFLVFKRFFCWTGSVDMGNDTPNWYLLPSTSFFPSFCKLPIFSRSHPRIPWRWVTRSDDDWLFPFSFFPFILCPSREIEIRLLFIAYLRERVGIPPLFRIRIGRSSSVEKIGVFVRERNFLLLLLLLFSPSLPPSSSVQEGSSSE